MKQVLVGKGISIADVPAPGLRAGQVLVEVAYSFISSGTELAGVKSASSSVFRKVKEHPQRIAQVVEMMRINGVKKTLARVRSKLESRSATGYSCAGRVIATGDHVTRLAVGDRVACAGQGHAVHAEVVAVPVNLVAKVPCGCDFRSASGTTVASIALQGVRRADLRLGETAAVMGLGLLGQITLQMLRASGVQVLGFDPELQRVEEARQLGFTNCFPLSGTLAADQVTTATDGMGADTTIITAATRAPGICQDAMMMTRRKGRVVIVGAVPLEFERDPFYRKEIDFVISCSYGPGRYDSTYEDAGQDYPYAYVRWTENRNMQAVLRMIADGGLRMDPLISMEFPADQADAAFASLAAEEGVRPLAAVLKYDLAEETPDTKLSTEVSLPTPRPHEGKIAVGIVGLGQFCKNTHLPNLAALGDQYQVVSVCTRNGGIAQDTARQLGAAQACSDPEALLANAAVDLVLLATRHDSHAPLAVAALRAGKHVFTEKPLAMNESQLGELVEIARASGRYLMVGFNRRFSPHATHLRKLCISRHGPLILNYRVFADPAPRDSWIHTPAGGGRAIGEACHMLDLMNFLVGDDVHHVELDVVAPGGDLGGPPADNFVASIRYEDGSLGTLTYSTLGRKSKENGKERVEAMWDGKSYLIDDFKRSIGAGCSAGSVGNKVSKGHYEELVALADYLQARGPEPVTLAACIRATEMSFRIDHACRN